MNTMTRNDQVHQRLAILKHMGVDVGEYTSAVHDLVWPPMQERIPHIVKIYKTMIPYLHLLVEDIDDQ